MKQTDKNIKEIRIYHSLWKNILLTVGCFAFAVGGYFILHDANTSWPTKVFGGIGSMVFFGCGGMYNPQNEMFSHFGTKRYNFKNETQLFKVIPHTSKIQKNRPASPERNTFEGS